MSAKNVLRLALPAVLLLIAAPATLAAADGQYQGEFLLGYRFVDFDGSETKYREDVNLDDGPRLFALSVYAVPDGGLRKVADRVQLDISNYGGDPFEGLSFSVEKHGRYDFDYRRTKSEYFYEDVILPVALADPRISDAGDFHHFDFDRVRDIGSLKVNLSPRAKVNVGFERFTKKGESTTTLDISRDEFELDKPVDESYNDIRVGFEYSWSNATLLLEERWRDYENDVDLFLPGRSLGENTTNATILDFYFLSQPYDYESQDHVVRLNATPTDRLLIQASAVIQSLDLDATAAERAKGIDFRGNPFESETFGGGEIERDTDLFDLDISYLLSDRFALVGSVRQYNLDQSGGFDFGSAANVGEWDLETTSFQAGFEATVNPQLVLGLGALIESRDVDYGHATDGSIDELEEVSTDHDGFYANLNWRPGDRFKLDVSYEDSSYDDPFTLSSPTDRERLRLRLEGTAESGLYGSLIYLLNSFENGDSGWSADRDQLTARVGYRRDDLVLSAGYSMFETERSIDQVVTTSPGFMGGLMFPFPIFYESDADFIDFRLRWQATERLTVGGDCLLYDNSGTFALERDDIRGWLEVGFRDGYLLRLSYRTLDYEEDAVNFDDYEADIAEVGIGYRF